MRTNTHNMHCINHSQVKVSVVIRYETCKIFCNWKFKLIHPVLRPNITDVCTMTSGLGSKRGIRCANRDSEILNHITGLIRNYAMRTSWSYESVAATRWYYVSMSAGTCVMGTKSQICWRLRTADRVSLGIAHIFIWSFAYLNHACLGDRRTCPARKHNACTCSISIR